MSVLLISAHPPCPAPPPANRSEVPRITAAKLAPLRALGIVKKQRTDLAAVQHMFGGPSGFELMYGEAVEAADGSLDYGAVDWRRLWH